MNILVSVFVLAGFAVLAQASNNVGNCTLQVYTQRERVCTSAFIRGLQQQPKISCRPKLEEFFNCTMKVVKGCMPTLDAAGEAAVRAALEKEATENKMCEMAGMHFDDPEGTNQTFPCNMTKDEYEKQTGSCYEDFKRMWQKNRNDDGLCSEFTKVKKCVQDIMTSKCTITGDFKAKADLMFDDYNPFCSEGPTSKATNINALAVFNIAAFYTMLAVFSCVL